MTLDFGQWRGGAQHIARMNNCFLSAICTWLSTSHLWQTRYTCQPFVDTSQHAPSTVLKKAFSGLQSGNV